MKHFIAWFWGKKEGYIGPYSYTETIIAKTKKDAKNTVDSIAKSNNWRFIQFI